MLRLLSILFLLGHIHLFAQDYAISKIDSSLLKDASLVVRKDDTKIKIIGNKSMTTDYHKVVTVLKKEDKSMANIVLDYDPFTALSKIEINIYDQHGDLIKSVKPNNLGDYSHYDYTIADDNRYKFYSVKEWEVPFTVELKYTENHKGILGIPQWEPQWTTNMSIESAGLSISVEDNILRYKELNFPKESKIQSAPIYRWSLNNIPAHKYESNMPFDYEIYPMVFLAVENFNYDKTEGSFQDWVSLGKWEYELIESVTTSDEKIQKVVAEIKDRSTDKRDLVYNVYDYLQKNSRYVSVQLGIGGWKPFSPSYVHEKGYGDCKALSNYTRALLKEAGINAHYTVIGNGVPSIYLEDFATFFGQANHVILCVPMEGDTIWLECTNQNIQPGYLGNSNANRNVLLTDKNGGKIVKTPKYDYRFNAQKFETSVNVNIDGSATIESHNLWKGNFYRLLNYFIGQPESELNTAFLKVLDLNSPNILENRLELLVSDTPTVEQQLKVQTPKFANKVGSRLIFNLNPLIRLSYSQEQSEERIHDIFIQNEESRHSVTTFTIPENYQIDRLPENVNLQTDFGSFLFEIEHSSNTIQVTKEIIIISGKHPAEKHSDWLTFMNAIDKGENSKAILKVKD